MLIYISYCCRNQRVRLTSMFARWHVYWSRERVPVRMPSRMAGPPVPAGYGRVCRKPLCQRCNVSRSRWRLLVPVSNRLGWQELWLQYEHFVTRLCFTHTATFFITRTNYTAWFFVMESGIHWLWLLLTIRVAISDENDCYDQCRNGGTCVVSMNVTG